MISLTREQQDIASKYTKLLKQHELSHLSLDWGSKTSQWKRFEVLNEVGDLEGKSILDVGCGLCDFYKYLSDIGIKVDYHGVDITEEMIRRSSQQFTELSLEVRDIVATPFEQKFDYVFGSGVFAYMSQASLAYELIVKMFEAAKVAVAFNSLSQWSAYQENNELSLDPVETLNICKKLSSNIVLRHDYMPHDFTLYLYR